MRRRILALLFLTSIFLCLTASGFAQQLGASDGRGEQTPQAAGSRRSLSSSPVTVRCGRCRS